MGIALTDIPHDGRTYFSDRWVFQLSEPLNCALGETMLVDGRSTVPVTTAAVKRWIVSHGNYMTGCARIVGEPLEIGDCGGLVPKPEPVIVERPVGNEPMLPPARVSPPIQEWDTDAEIPSAKALQQKGKHTK